VHPHLDALVGPLDPTEPVDEVHVPRRAPELPVRRRLQSHPLLHRDDVPDRLVLGRTQCRDVDLPRRVRRTRRQQGRRAEQASDVVGPERRFGAGRHAGRLASRRRDHRPPWWAGRALVQAGGMDEDLRHRITELVDEEHHLERAHIGRRLSDDERARLDALGVELDRTWDLLRRREARRRAGQDPDTEQERTTAVVEGYQQ
jgi:hypothetical protein